MIAQKTRYALRSLLFLAEEQGGAPVQLGRIAETQRVPPKYLELIMLDLKKAGLVKSARGPKGGYKLSRAGRRRFRSAKSCARWKGRSRWFPAPASISTRHAATARTKRPARSAAPSRSFATRARGARFIRWRRADGRSGWRRQIGDRHGRRSRRGRCGWYWAAASLFMPGLHCDASTATRDALISARYGAPCVLARRRRFGAGACRCFALTRPLDLAAVVMLARSC